jgi:nicotinamidase-related amidase
MRNLLLTFVILSPAFGPTVLAVPGGKDAPPIANRPKVPGKLRLHLRERSEQPAGSGKVRVVERTVDWDAARTAIIICDMWDDHYCKSAAQRVKVMVPRMNEVITAARNHGVMIIHAPSGTVSVYDATPYRKRMKQAKQAKPPVPIASWCHLDLKREPPMPVDTSKCPCDDPVVGPAVRKFNRQHDGLDIIGFDGVSDSGPEIYNFLVQEGIDNVVLMGVHTNMCVLGRPFGIRQMVRLGKNVVLCRDLTDAMYDPRQPPYVSHARGTELVVEHIERYWCPSIRGEDLTRVVPGTAGPLPSTAGPRRGK